MELEFKSRILKLLKEDEEFRYAVAGLIGLEEILKRLDRHEEVLEEILKRLDRHEGELIKLRKDMNKGFELINRYIFALGAKWGFMAEEAFREGLLKGILVKELGLEVEKWEVYDEKGKVFGYPSVVEIDIAIKDKKLILVEVSSYVRASDIYQFKRKAELYEEKTGKKPEKLIIVTPYAEEKAIEASKKLGVEVYTKI